jgi:hypothetical protein
MPVAWRSLALFQLDNQNLVPAVVMDVDRVLRGVPPNNLTGTAAMTVLLSLYHSRDLAVGEIDNQPIPPGLGLSRPGSRLADTTHTHTVILKLNG